ncbi:hypothetical protein Rhe02_93390 [Rhizocola hellebori]|uniref:Phospholipase A2 n=1 Tax=Rhizocola hellebori TaxID=1392758 RepID=A0A8J3QKG9_9ACTN|nr:phospholipase [Rhizocola hellebori]GIH11272.1 hypothetical protein Rhe02_93390 [Rhizocola hellebori]
MLGSPKWLLTPLIAAAAVIALASPAAAVTAEEKLAVLSSFTQTNSASYDAWNGARQNQPAWAAYTLNWSTDYCSSSPDNPLGFDFALSCYRHDFGYRNFKEMGQFSANKSRLDSAFYEDLKRRCSRYNWAVRPACYSLAWTYYQAVSIFGSVVVTADDLKRAQDLMPKNGFVS